jgi:hypothetical protein
MIYCSQDSFKKPSTNTFKTKQIPENPLLNLIRKKLIPPESKSGYYRLVPIVLYKNSEKV